MKGIKRKQDGTFAKGTMGKPKGAISEKTRIWNEAKHWFVNEGMEAYLETLSHMKQENPAEFMKRFEAMMEYFQPKLSRSDVDVTTGGEKVNIPISSWVKD